MTTHTNAILSAASRRKHLAIRNISKFISLAGIFLLTATSSKAAILTVTGGHATVDYDSSSFTPGTFDNLAFFNQNSNSIPYADIVAGTWTPTNSWILPGDVRGWTGLVHDFNGSTVTSPAGRYLQATNFSYDPSDLTGTATGQIGLGGMARLELNSEVSSDKLH